jgi:hypothetical protein
VRLLRSKLKLAVISTLFEFLGSFPCHDAPPVNTSGFSSTHGGMPSEEPSLNSDTSGGQFEYAHMSRLLCPRNEAAKRCADFVVAGGLPKWREGFRVRLVYGVIASILDSPSSDS